MPVRPLPAWPAGRPLRAWQEEAAAVVLAHPQRSFLASATPAAGKTTFGLHVAHRMLSERRVARVCIVAPPTHIARQWAADAARYGLDVEPNRPNAAGPEPGDRHGVAVTGEPHRAIHGRINRETGAGSVTAASVEQLERGNRLLERQAKRR